MFSRHYVATDAGIPEDELLASISSYLQERREISVDMQVLSPTPVPVDITVAVQPAPGTAFDQAQAAAEQALRAAFTGALLGQGVRLAQLGDLLYHLESIQNYRFSAPAGDMEASPTVLPTLGTLTIAEWEA